MRACFKAQSIQDTMPALDLPIGPQDAKSMCDNKGENFRFFFLKLKKQVFIFILSFPNYETYIGYIVISVERIITSFYNGFISRNLRVSF